MVLENIPFDKITEEDLISLINNKIGEDKTIDYKESFCVQTPEEKKEFLKDISAFANTQGGHIIFGMKEEKGIAVELSGIDIENFDKDKQHLENLIRDCIHPRVYGVEINKPIRLQNTKAAIVVRIPRSYNPPHMVKISKHRLFYGRNSAGNYPLNVEDLRELFGLSGTIQKMALEFRAERIYRITTGQKPIPLLKGPKYVLHMIPFYAFRTGTSYDLSKFGEDAKRLPNITWRVSDGRFNFDGFVSYHGVIKPKNPEPTCSYTQLFRNGIIEAVDMEYNPTLEGKVQKELNVNYENRVIRAVGEFLSIQKELGVTPPVFVMLSLIQVKGVSIISGTNRYSTLLPGIPLEEENLVLPEVMVTNFSGNVGGQLSQIFDIVLNAAGLTRKDIQ